MSKQDTIRTALRSASARLAQADIESASLDARLMMQHALGMAHEQMLLQDNEPLSPSQRLAYDTLLRRRLAREPVAQILGSRDFWKHSFRVSADTLSPRPESETLIEAVLKYIPTREAQLRMLDIGTGTGCLIVSLLMEYANATGEAVDASPAALRVARANAQQHRLNTRCNFTRSIWCDAVQGQYDLIISNPPYIPTGELAGLAPELAHEPRMALDGGASGLDAYRALAPQVKQHLAPQGLGVFELGFGQAADVAAILASAGLALVDILPDLAGIPRAIVFNHTN